jgi:UDP-N-acetylmuramoylalanine--D-glutamate ligase
VKTPNRAVVIGLGVCGRGVVRALVDRGCAVLVVDDATDPERRRRASEDAAELGAELVVTPDADEWPRLLGGVDALLPSPGVPDHHAALAAAEASGVPVHSELDLARSWDDRTVVAVTGTNGKTTVTSLVTAMLRASGIAAVEAGNSEAPLVSAIDDPDAELFVVEASSFQLGRTHDLRPLVATWLNFAPDHLDAHRDLASYEVAKARIWADVEPGGLLVANAEDPVVLSRIPEALPDGVRVERFGLDPRPDHGPAPDWTMHGDHLVGPGDIDLGPADTLWRQLPVDLANAFAAAATARGAGATVDGIVGALATFGGLPHRVALVAEADGVRWYDDSKATTPQATAAGLAGFDRAVLIAGGRNKGLDLSPLADGIDHIRSVVAIGEATDEVAAVFAGRRPVVRAASMAEAVARAGEAARSGDAVLLSPACASFDWYRNYGERGDDFARLVAAHLTGASDSGRNP